MASSVWRDHHKERRRDRRVEHAHPHRHAWVHPILVDLGQMRSSARTEQAIADYAALAAGRALSEGDPNTACQDAIKYLNQNDKRISTRSTRRRHPRRSPERVRVPRRLVPRVARGAARRSPSTTRCPTVPSRPAMRRNSRTGSARGRTTARRAIAARHCQPQRQEPVRRHLRLEQGRHYAERHGRPAAGGRAPPALWLLDPHGCKTPLKVDGGSQVTVGTSTVQGVITIDSDGTDATCTSNIALNVTGSGSFVKAIGPPSVGRPARSTSSHSPTARARAAPRVRSANVSSGHLAPQPQHGWTRRAAAWTGPTTAGTTTRRAFIRRAPSARR